MVALSYFDTAEYRRLANRRDSLRHSPGNLHFNEAEIANVLAQIDSERWEYEHPDALSCFRVQIRGRLVDDYRTRYETRAEAEQAIRDQLGAMSGSEVCELATRRGLDALTTKYREAA